MPVEVVRRHDPDSVREILASVPEWLGIPEASASYVDDAGRLPSYLAIEGDEVVGRALLTAIEADLRESGVRILEVHTVGPSSESAEYAQTREFYLAEASWR